MNDLESRLRAALHDETAELAARPELADDLVTRGTKVRRRRRVVVGAAGLVVLAAVAVPAWKTIDTSSEPLHPVKPTQSAITQAPAPTAPTTPTTPTTQTPPGWSTKTVDVSHSPAQVPLVTALRVAEHPTYDRVVVDFSGPLPSYHIEYVRRLFEEGSGAGVHVPGNAILAIRLMGADGHTPAGESLVRAGEKHRYPYTTLKGTVVTGDFEGNVSFGLGLSRKAGFQVDELTSPTRLVIDVQH